MRNFNENWDGVVRKNTVSEQVTPGKMQKIVDVVKKYLTPINRIEDTGKVGNFVRLAKAWKEIDAIYSDLTEDESVQSQMRKAGVSARHIKLLSNMYSWVAYEASPDHNRKMYRFHSLKPQDINDLWVVWKYDWSVK